MALVGQPNVGKSTLLNALTGEKLSIVTPRAQTTRERVMGIYTDSSAQIIFVDTPGLLEPRYLLQRSMLESALAALADADLVLLLLDATRPEDTCPMGEALDALLARRDELFVVINKIDLARDDAVSALQEWVRERFGLAPIRISAEDEIAVQPVRFFVSELVRETIFEEYHEEVPYSTAVRIEEFREAEDPVFIRAVVFVERESQKGILVGKGGAGIRRLGQLSREKIEAFLGRRVYLDLWVKAMPRWRKKRTALEHLGYPVPKDEPRAGR